MVAQESRCSVIDPANGKTARNMKCHIDRLGKWLNDRREALENKDYGKSQRLIAELVVSSFLSSLHSDAKLLLVNYIDCAAENGWSPSQW